MNKISIQVTSGKLKKNYAYFLIRENLVNFVLIKQMC